MSPNEPHQGCYSLPPAMGCRLVLKGRLNVELRNLCGSLVVHVRCIKVSLDRLCDFVMTTRTQVPTLNRALVVVNRTVVVVHVRAT